MGRYLTNLARSEFDKGANKEVYDELVFAGIQPVSQFVFDDDDDFSRREVKTEWVGFHKNWIFRRAWSYWVASSKAGVPLNKSIAFYEHTKDMGLCIRTDGFAGNIHPYVFGNDKYATTMYHIDSIRGLCYFRLFLDGVLDDIIFYPEYSVNPKNSSIIERIDLSESILDARQKIVKNRMENNSDEFYITTYNRMFCVIDNRRGEEENNYTGPYRVMEYHNEYVELFDLEVFKDDKELMNFLVNGAKVDMVRMNEKRRGRES